MILSRFRSFRAKYGHLAFGLFACACGIAVLVIVLMMVGCRASSSAAPPVNAATEVVKAPDGTVTTRTVSSTGPAYAARGDKVAAETTAEAGAVTIEDGKRIAAGPSSGAGDVSAKISGVPILTILGAVLLCGGIATLFYPVVPRGVGAAAIASGVVLMAIGIYPALLLWGLGALAVGLFAYLLVLGKNAQKNRDALTAVVKGVENAPPEAAVAVKTSIGTVADPSVKATIDTLKVKEYI